MASHARVGITMGDPSGIGPEIIARALPAITRFCQPVIIGDAWVFNRACCVNRIPSDISFDFIEMANVPRAGFSFGKLRPEYGKASMGYIDEAITLLDRGLIDCLVTCPVSKEAVSLGWGKGKFRGHTEYLARRACVKKTVMMLLNRQLRFGLVTTHVPLKDVSRLLTRENISDTAAMTGKALKQWFGIARPRIAVAGLNPHASDNGVIGSEEKRVITPAVKKAARGGLRVDGPIPADTCCSRALAGEYDAVIAMYHDQALIALKSTDPYSGVNLTVGLPYVRTSPLHGTAFDIAGKGKASAASLIAAAETACTCATRQKNASARIS